MDATDATNSLGLRLLVGLRLAVEQILARNTLIVWLSSAAFAAYTGPFGSYRLFSLPTLFFAWSVLIGGATIVVFVTFEMCRAVMPNRTRAFRDIFFFPIGSILTCIVIDILLVFWMPRSSPDSPGWLELWLYVTPIMVIVSLIKRSLRGGEGFARESGSVSTPAPASLPAQSRLAQRLDVPVDVRIIHISANGHFVEVETCTQTLHVRMRFCDAVAELDETTGLTVHRSHWVHRDAIRGWVPNAPKPFVILENEVQIPVSKTYIEKVQSAGLVELVNPDTEMELDASLV